MALYLVIVEFMTGQFFYPPTDLKCCRENRGSVVTEVLSAHIPSSPPRVEKPGTPQTCLMCGTPKGYLEVNTKRQIPG